MSWVYVAVAVVAAAKYQDNRQQQAQLDAQARANDFNAAVLRQRADAVTSAANVREENQLRKNRYLAGKRAAAIAESGFEYSGSMVDFAAQSDAEAELDALNIRYEGQLEATGLLAQAQQESYYAESARANRTNVRRNAPLSVAAAALTTYAGYGGKG